MPQIKLKNNAATSISAAIVSTIATTITVVDATKLPQISSAGEYFFATIEEIGDFVNVEIVKVTGISGNTLTVERGQEGTVARTFSANAGIEQRVTSQTLQDLVSVWDRYGSTAWISGGEITVNVDPTKVDIAQVYGVYVDNFTDPNNVIKKQIVAGPFVGVSILNIGVQPFTRILIDSNGGIVQRFVLTTEDLRDNFVIGEVTHSNLSTIDGTTPFTSVPSGGIPATLYDFAAAIGDVNTQGNEYSANGANLNINRSAGSVFSLWSNAANDLKNPSIKAFPADIGLTFIYTFRNGAGGFSVSVGNTSINPNIYDDGSVTGASSVPLGVVTKDKFTKCPIFLAQDGSTIIHYGQELYASMDDAVASIGADNFEVNPALSDVLLRGWVIVEKDTLALNNLASAKFISAGKFGSGSTGIGQGIGASQAFRDYIPQNTPPAFLKGRVFYDAVRDTLVTYDGAPDTPIAMNKNLTIRVKNNTGSLIPKGSVVSVASMDAGIPTIVLSDASDLATVTPLGIVVSDVVAGELGLVFTHGPLLGINTLGFTTGDRVFVSETAGEFTASAPENAHSVGIIGTVDAVNGSLLVALDKHTYVTTDLVDVADTVPTANQVMQYNFTTKKWSPSTLTKASVGLANVDNTSDADKPISTAVQAALDDIEALALAGI